jgi:hypothetical protein
MITNPFSVGDRVGWISRKGIYCSGVISRINGHIVWVQSLQKGTFFGARLRFDALVLLKEESAHD